MNDKADTLTTFLAPMNSVVVVLIVLAVAVSCSPARSPAFARRPEATHACANGTLTFAWDGSANGTIPVKFYANATMVDTDGEVSIWGTNGSILTWVYTVAGTPGTTYVGKYSTTLKQFAGTMHSPPPQESCGTWWLTADMSKCTGQCSSMLIE